jgi:hypothetical protein
MYGVFITRRIEKSGLSADLVKACSLLQAHLQRHSLNRRYNVQQNLKNTWLISQALPLCESLSLQLISAI